MVTNQDIIDSFLETLKSKEKIEVTTRLFVKVPPNEKVAFVYSLLEMEDLLPSYVHVSSKSSQQSLQYRSLGNKAFYQKKDADALKYYTKSVSFAPSNSEELSVAYANRSAVLFKLKKYDLCLLDIDRALGKNYPDLLKYKLLERKGRCLLEIGHEENAKQSFQDALAYLPVSDVSHEQRSNNKNTLQQLISKCNNNFEKTTKTENDRMLSFSAMKIPSNNKLIPNASSSIQISYSLEMGRHITASQNIEPGDILAIEKPFASVLLREFYLSHCSNCFRRNEAMVPCDNCSLIMFCNHNCREECLKRFHTIECKILPFLLSLELGKMELLSVRTLMIATNQGKLLGSLFQDPALGKPLPFPVPSELLNIDETYLSDEYKFVHMLEDNFLKRNVSDLFQKLVTIAVMVHVMKQSPFFDFVQEEPIPLTDLEMFTGSLLLKYLLIILCNAHEISEIVEERCKPNSKISDGSLEVGAALYPFLSLINHSCDPNVVRHSYGNGVVLRAIQPVAAGQQIFDNYGYHYAVHELPKRQSQLQTQYFFTCSCEACKFDWPLYANLPSKNPEYLSNKVDVVELQESSKNFRKILLKIVNLDRDGHVDHLHRHLSLLHKSIKRPWKEYSECQEAIKQCLAFQANYHTDVINVTI